jgi:pimeloyl-ACP methyl ester carboxylesterase
MDRRGRGGSADAEEYALEREYEDVAAVVDAVAEASGSAVDLYGHSHGGICAFGGATLTSNIRKLVLYEGWALPNPEVYALPADLEEHMDALLASGNLDAVVETLFRELESMSEEDLSALRSAPSWPGRRGSRPHDHSRAAC